MAERTDVGRRNVVIGGVAAAVTLPMIGAARANNAKDSGEGAMSLDDYASQDAVGLADLVKKGEVKAEELANLALEAIDAVNPRLNAVIETFPERAASATNEGPLGGVPFLRKDILLQEEGGLSEFGSRLAVGLRMLAATELALRYDRAGLTTLGRTTTPEMGFNGATETVKDGPTRNPWNPDYSVGGSSGGSAAMVASGAVPAAYANDGGGSIRIPAGCCGAVGLKPTRGRIPLGPAHGSMLLGLICEHAITRSLRDTAAILDATHGASPGDPFVIIPPTRAYVEEIGAPVGRLKIAYAKESWTGIAADPEIAEAVERVAALCAELGHEVVEGRPEINAEAYAMATMNAWCGFLAMGVDGLAAATDRVPSLDTLESSTLACYEYGKSLSAADVFIADEIFNASSRQAAGFFASCDMLLTPTLAQPVAPVGAPFLNANAPGITAEAWVSQIFSYAPFTSLFNVTGQPGISLPLEQDSGGLPIGIQFVGQYGDEAGLLRLAASLEEARPWKDRRPAIWAGNPA